MPKFTLGNSFRFGSKRETVSNFHSESIETILQKLTKDWLGHSGGKSRNVRQRFPTTPSLISAAVRGGSRDRGPTIFSPLIEKEDLAFLKKEDCFASLEKIGSAELIEEDSKLRDSKLRQIRSEIITASQIRHRNILPLLAHMVRPDCHLLVYEFMKNGSLQDILDDVSRGRRELDWPSRHRIALGVASGLEYLHMYHSASIIHGDIKPRNVLLNDDMEACISDLGLAMAIPDGYTRVLISYVLGTMAYIAPEYFQQPELSEKCDIFSFGMLLISLVRGVPSFVFHQNGEEICSPEWLRKVMNSKNPSRAIDPRLPGNGYEKKMLHVLKIAYICTLHDPEERPNSQYVRCRLSQLL
ncbi:hypothetical protein CUMW_084190 [Citrus unshiu]|nr:hypothetical protein CUMW_084190 [Citrus unshiu]